MTYADFLDLYRDRISFNPGDECALWALARDPEKVSRLATVLYTLVEGLRVSSVLLEAVIPGKARELREQLGLDAADLLERV